MTSHSEWCRRRFLAGLAGTTMGTAFLGQGNAFANPSTAIASGGAAIAAEEAAAQATNMVGAYGPWLSGKILGNKPGKLSLRSGNWPDLAAWRVAARNRAWECIAPVDLGGKPEIKLESRHEFDGLSIERLSWQLPCGPRTQAVVLKPANAKGRLPAVLGLHDHGGNKYLGWRKIVRTDDKPWEVQRAHQEYAYEGVAWANELAKRGYVVLVHDTFPFASRRVLVADVPPVIQEGAKDPEPDDLEGIKLYNRFAANHEHIWAKSLHCAGTTWPGVYVVEDQRALDVLCARDDVDADRVGCAGLSGGGLRTVYLGGLDDRIRCAIAVGFMSTWSDFLLQKCFTHTWMTYVPLLPKDLEFPEILGLRAPAATMVQSCNEDGLYTLPEMHNADNILKEVFDRAKGAENYRGEFYPGGHKFDLAMQRDAFAWFDRHLKNQ